MKRGHETIQTGWHFLSVYLGPGAHIFWKGVAISPCQILANDYHDFQHCATNGAMLCVVWARNLPQSEGHKIAGQLRGERIAERRQPSLAELTLTRIRWSLLHTKGSIC